MLMIREEKTSEFESTVQDYTRSSQLSRVESPGEPNSVGPWNRITNLSETGRNAFSPQMKRGLGKTMRRPNATPTPICHSLDFFIFGRFLCSW